MNRSVTEAQIFEDCYDRQERERELIVRMWEEMPNDQVAVMTARQAKEYLGVSRSSMIRWEERGILVPMIAPNKYRYYFIGHLWVFKVLWLERDN